MKMFAKIDKTKLNEGEKAFVEQIAEGVKEYVGEVVKPFATVEDVASGKKEVGEAIAALKAAFEKNETRTDDPVKMQFMEQTKDFRDESGKLDVQAMKAARKTITLDFVKAAGTVTVAGNVSASNLGVAVEPGIDRYPRAWSPLRDVASVGTVSAPTLVIAEYASGEGGAAWTEEGGLKPLLDGDLSQRTVTAGKVAVRAKFSEEVLEDYPEFVAEVRGEMIDSLGMAESYGVLYGSGTSGEITGVASFMPSYTMQGFVVDQPNYLDVLNAAYAQIMANTEFNYLPNSVMMNVTDIATMWNTKTTSGQPLYNDYRATFDAAKLNIIAVNSSVLPAGNFIMGDFRFLNIRDRKPLTVQVGWENDDFSKNLVTVVAEKRVMAFIKNQHKYAFVKDTFANVLEAITPGE